MQTQGADADAQRIDVLDGHVAPAHEQHSDSQVVAHVQRRRPMIQPTMVQIPTIQLTKPGEPLGGVLGQVGAPVLGDLLG